MHILFVSPTPPVPTSGGRARLYNLIKQLAARHDISLLTLVQPDEQEMLATTRAYYRTIDTVPFAPFPSLGKWQNRLQGWGRILFSHRPRYAMVFSIDRLRRPLRRLMASHQFDVVVLQGLYVAELVDEISVTPVILATENTEAAIARQRLANARNGVHRLRDWLEWRKLRDYECAMVRRFRVCIAVSDLDVHRLSAISPHTEVRLVPNGVDTEAFFPTGANRRPNEILFFGTLNYGPNADGIRWFSHEMLPRVNAAIPDARLVILGKDPPERVKALGVLPGVELVGFVPDVRARLWSSTLSIAPLRSGGGTRLKILESLAAKCPVVSTTLGAEGLGLSNGQHAIIADTAEEFSQGVIRLLRDPELRGRLAENGQRVVAQHYNWQPISVNLEQACVRAIQLYGADTRATSAD